MGTVITAAQNPSIHSDRPLAATLDMSWSAIQKAKMVTKVSSGI